MYGSSLCIDCRMSFIFNNIRCSSWKCNLSLLYTSDAADEEDSEGVRYEEPKLKMMGIEAVKSSTPAPCRKMIKDALKIMMNGSEDDMIDYIDACRKEFKKLPPEEIAFPRTASDVVKYKAHSTIYAKGTPIHIPVSYTHLTLPTKRIV